MKTPTIYYLIIILLLALTTISCKQYYYITNEASTYEMNQAFVEDSAVLALVKPYKERLDVQMDQVIGECAQDLAKEKPECLLGNFMADAILKKCEEYSEKTIDFSVVNYGGIRIPNLPAGPITVRRIYELMPFENTLVVVHINGETTQAFFEHIAKQGGWPISSGVQLKTDTLGNLHSASINGQAIDTNRDYTVALSDFLANGGDKCAFLIDKDRDDLGVLFRDALIEYIEDLTKNQKMLNSQLEGRVIYE